MREGYAERALLAKSLAEGPAGRYIDPAVLAEIAAAPDDNEMMRALAKIPGRFMAIEVLARPPEFLALLTLVADWLSDVVGTIARDRVRASYYRRQEDIILAFLEGP